MLEKFDYPGVNLFFLNISGENGQIFLKDTKSAISVHLVKFSDFYLNFDYFSFESEMQYTEKKAP